MKASGASDGGGAAVFELRVLLKVAGIAGMFVAAGVATGWLLTLFPSQL